jgi:predicted CoA-binding protein
MTFSPFRPGPAFPLRGNRCSMTFVDAVIDKILSETRTVAVVGISDSPDRPSNEVARYLQSKGYRVIPVNPFIQEALGEKSYGSLSDIPEKVDLVDVFRNSGDVLPVAEEAIRVGARFFWMQEGVVNEAARDLLAKSGIAVVMDRCVKKEIGKRASQPISCPLPPPGRSRSGGQGS